MISFIISLTISLCLLVFYILFTLRYKALIQNLTTISKEERKEAHISRYVSEGKKEVMKQKLDQVSKIIRETEEEVQRIVQSKLKSAEFQSTKSFNEDEIIKAAGKDYDVFMAGLVSAMPKTKEELTQDIENLEDTIKKLESYDILYYEDESKAVNIGTGIFYDKMSRKFNSIIKENKLNEYPIIPIQRLKYFAYNEIKGIKDDDFFSIIQIMKATKLIPNFIEIDADFYIIVFLEESLELSNAEKVVLSFAYAEDILTIQHLLELTGWDFTYASKTINNLKQKELAFLEDENISIKGFGTFEERNNWNAVINTQTFQEKEKEEKKAKRQLELKAKLKSSLEQVKEEKLKLVESNDITITTPEIENLEEEIPQKKFEGRPKVKTLPIAKSKGKVVESDSLDLPLDFEDIKKEDSDLNEIISQRILDFHEKFSLVNGGFCQYEKLKDFVIQAKESISEDILNSVLNNLIELKLISKSIIIGKAKFYLFTDLELTTQERNFIKYALNKAPLKKVDFKKGLKWKEEQVLEIMKALQNKSILRIESDKIIIPGIIQKK